MQEEIQKTIEMLKQELSVPAEQLYEIAKLYVRIQSATFIVSTVIASLAAVIPFGLYLKHFYQQCKKGDASLEDDGFTVVMVGLGALCFGLLVWLITCLITLSVFYVVYPEAGVFDTVINQLQ